MDLKSEHQLRSWQSTESLHRGCLASTVVTQEGRDLTFVKVQVQVLQGHFAIGVDLGEVLDRDSERQVLGLGLDMLRRLSHDGVGDAALADTASGPQDPSASDPVGLGQEEVPGLGHAVLTRKHGFDVPGEGHGLQQLHDDNIQ